ncbi:MAG: dehypoxanthine futalosine cyclase [Deltaproteobacteria bacterium]|nr:dehypoxanthine futalosine cyclase [Deltaproteobacteria bacterium]
MKRLDRTTALRLFQSEPLLSLGSLAHRARMELHPEHTVSFVMDTNINYTNVCDVGCLFCAFYRPKGHRDAYVMDSKELKDKLDAAHKYGVTTVLLQGGMHPDLKLDYYTELIAFIKGRYPDMHIHAFSPPEIIRIAEVSGMSVKDTITALKSAGLMSIPGGGAEILAERVRRAISPAKPTVDAWLSVMETAHAMGIPTTATMMYGHVETPEEVIEHLDRLRALQDRTHGFTAFIAWDFKPANTVLGRRIATRHSAEVYLRTVAVARLYLDNFKNVQASWSSQGRDIGQLSLYFGANDFGSLLLEENVMRLAGHRLVARRDEIVQMIRDAGFTPVQRTTFYDTVRVF